MTEGDAQAWGNEPLPSPTNAPRPRATIGAPLSLHLSFLSLCLSVYSSPCLSLSLLSRLHVKKVAIPLQHLVLP